MQCPQCDEKQVLRFEVKDPSMDEEIPFCFQCGVPISSKLGFFHCEKCKFALCTNCKVCKNNHLLQRVYDLSSMGTGTYKTNNYGCDGCGSFQVNFKEIGVYHCQPCQFDLCDKCAKTHVANNYPSSHQDSFQKDQSRESKELEGTVFICGSTLPEKTPISMNDLFGTFATFT